MELIASFRNFVMVVSKFKQVCLVFKCPGICTMQQEQGLNEHMQRFGFDFNLHGLHVWWSLLLEVGVGGLWCNFSFVD